MKRAALLLSLTLSVAVAQAQRRTPVAVPLETLRLPAERDPLDTVVVLER